MIKQELSLSHTPAKKPPKKWIYLIFSLTPLFFYFKEILFAKTHEIFSFNSFLRTSKSHVPAVLPLKIIVFVLLNRNKMRSSTRNWLNHPHVVCCICRGNSLTEIRKTVSDSVKKAYPGYRAVMLGDPEKSWLPHQVCDMCREQLRQWTTEK